MTILVKGVRGTERDDCVNKHTDSTICKSQATNVDQSPDLTRIVRNQKKSLVTITNFFLVISICMAFPLYNNVCDTWFHYNIKHISGSCRHNADVGANTVELATKYNYKIQTHHVETEDGYILTIFRITNSTNSFNSSRPPIFLQHGSLSNSEIWLQRGQDSIGFVLTNMGFDVWLGNTRGNYNSPGHKIYTTDNKKYWDQTFDDLVRDVPAVIDYITMETKSVGNILFLGHSIGNGQVLAYASDRPEHAKRNVKAIICFAPAVYFPKNNFLAYVTKILLALPIDKIDAQTQFIRMFCTFNSVTIELCKYVLSFTTGVNENIDPASFPVFLSGFPDREALTPFSQYNQISETGEFKKFDYGFEQNLKVYGTARPPEYDISKVPIPVYTFIGTADVSTTLSDARKIHDQLLIENEIYELQNEGHLSYYISTNVREVLYKPFFNLLKKLEKDKLR